MLVRAIFSVFTSWKLCFPKIELDGEVVQKWSSINEMSSAPARNMSKKKKKQKTILTSFLGPQTDSLSLEGLLLACLEITFRNILLAVKNIFIWNFYFDYLDLEKKHVSAAFF